MIYFDIERQGVVHYNFNDVDHVWPSRSVNTTLYQNPYAHYTLWSTALILLATLSSAGVVNVVYMLVHVLKFNESIWSQCHCLRLTQREILMP